MRKHPVHGGWRGHKGVDYAAPTGTPIHATADGVVEFKGSQNGYGNTIILKHYGGYSTLYAHQSRFAAGLKKGDSVSQGQLIGYVGRSEEHTSELQSLMRISYAVFCLKNNNTHN